MIKFSLICKDEEHVFDGWFPSNEDYENQLAQGLVSCPICDSPARKNIMAPAVKTDKSPRERGAEQVQEWTDEHLVMGSKARFLLKKLESHVKENFDYVGDNFAIEARKADRGERSHEFYGKATDKEIKELLEDGIDVFNVPSIKDN